MMDNQSILTLLNSPNIGSKAVLKVLANNQSISFDSPNDIHKGIVKTKIDYKRIRIPDIEQVEQAWVKSLGIINRCDEENIEIITFKDNCFPNALRNIEDCPLILFVKGGISLLNNRHVAIVGTRKPSKLGEEMASNLAFELSKRGNCIVSGLALGIDTKAHMGALKGIGGTVAVLGHGLDMVFPQENTRLAEIITKEGMLLTEYPFNTPPNNGSYLKRNRIQSGLSIATIVIETNEKGGTMTTARYCKSHGRKLVVFNNPSQTSGGTNRLIETGKADFILDEDYDIQDLDEFIKNHKVSIPMQSNIF